MTEKSGFAAAEREDQIAEAESFYDLETETVKVSDLVGKVEALEREKGELVKNDEEVKEKKEVLGLKSEKEEMKELVKKVEEDGKVFDVIVERASGLESKVLELRPEASVPVSNGDEANAEEKLRVGKIEKDSMEDFLLEIPEINKAKALAEAKVSELESKIKGHEEEAKVKLVLKDSEIISLKKKVAELEADINSSGLELNNAKAEKKALENWLSVSNMKVGELETKLIIMQKKLEKLR